MQQLSLSLEKGMRRCEHGLCALNGLWFGVKWLASTTIRVRKRVIDFMLGKVESMDVGKGG